LYVEVVFQKIDHFPLEVTAPTVVRVYDNTYLGTVRARTSS